MPMFLLSIFRISLDRPLFDYNPFLFELGLFVLFWWFANMLRLVGIQRLRSEGYILSESNKVHRILIPDASEKLKL